MASKRISLKGKGADLFFGDYVPDTGVPPPLPDDRAQEIIAVTNLDEPTSDDRSSTPPSEQVSEQRLKQASSRASKHASMTLDPVEAIRRVVKRPGKEVVYVRLTPEEKGQLADVVYTYKRQGIRTSDNELGRIAINNLLADYRERGEQSVLAQVLAALEA